MFKKLSFLVIDDDKNVALTLKTIINKSYPDSQVFIATDGVEGWEMLTMHNPNIVIADITLPGLNAIQLVKRIREKKDLENTYVIVVTANYDRSQMVVALEQGADDFITKPFSHDELDARFKAAVRIVEMQNELNEGNELLIDLSEELRRDIYDMTLLAVKFCQARIPESTDMLKEVAGASIWIAKQMGETDEVELKDIEISALLSYAGKIFLPDTLVKTPVMINGIPSHNLMNQVPIFARDIISSIRRFKDIGKNLYHLYENFDGSGIPEKLQSWQIPLGSRIIRVILDFEEISHRIKDNPKKILDKMEQEAKRLYDHRVLILLDQYLASTRQTDSEFKELALTVSDLKEGMILTRDIVTNSGMKVMSSGGVLRESIINKILTINTSDPIIGSVFVKKD
ncbi:MAG: response regulator [FCB group bacterium]